MNKYIENIKFKKVIIAYIIILILSLVGTSTFIGVKYQDKIKLLYNYHQLSEVVGKENTSKIKNKLTKLSSNKEVVDTIIINNNSIIYTSNNIYNNNLEKILGTKKYYQDENNNIYKLDNKKDFILDLFMLEDKEDYQDNFQINKVDYTMTYLNNNTNKIIIITKISPIPHSELYIKISLSILLLLFMIYWIIVTLMIYQNAMKLKLNAYLWGLITLLTNVLGVLIYLFYIRNRITCNKCHTSNTKDSIYCISCGNKINISCKKCHTVISKKDKYCKSCGEKI